MSILPIIDPEFKSLIPPLGAEERDQLEQNILSHRKCNDAVILWEGKIVDGHNRYEICVNHGIEFEIKEVQLPSREAAKLWILENQLSRRNLTDAMRIEVALMKAKILRKKARKKQSYGGKHKTDAKSNSKLFPKSSKPKDDRIHVHEAIAAEAGVGKGTYYRYTDIKEQGTPELLENVRAGKLKIGTAHRMLPKEIIKQLARADKMYKFIETITAVNSSDDLPIDMRDKMRQLPVMLQEVLDLLKGENANGTASN